MMQNYDVKVRSICGTWKDSLFAFDIEAQYQSLDNWIGKTFMNFVNSFWIFLWTWQSSPNKSPHSFLLALWIAACVSTLQWRRNTHIIGIMRLEREWCPWIGERGKYSAEQRQYNVPWRRGKSETYGEWDFACKNWAVAELAKSGFVIKRTKVFPSFGVSRFKK